MIVIAVSLHRSMGSDRHLRRGLRMATNTSCKTLLESPLSIVSLLISSMALFLVDLLSSFRQLRCRASPLRTSAAACSSPAAMPKQQEPADVRLSTLLDENRKTKTSPRASPHRERDCHTRSDPSPTVANRFLECVGSVGDSNRTHVRRLPVFKYVYIYEKHKRVNLRLPQSHRN